MLEKVSKRPDSRDRDYRIELARDRIPDRFPSLSWFLEQRPPEVKACNDHATGLCKVRQTFFISHNSDAITQLYQSHIFWQVCESARINFDSFRKAVKAACKCKTKECPAWDCWCDDEDEDEETGGSCRCPTCDCDVCSSCKVINNMLSQSFV